MPQVFIDSTATPDQLRLTARFLQDLAALAEAVPVPMVEAPVVLPKVATLGLTLTPADIAEIAGIIPKAPTAAEAFGKQVDAFGAAIIPESVTQVPAGTIPPPPPPTDVATAPAASTANTTTQATPVQLDRDGFPHDIRIHSKDPKINADGRWRQRRGLDNPTLVAVETELRARSAQVIPPPPPAVIPPPPVASAPAAATVMVPPPPAVVAALPSGPDAFITLMNLISPHTDNGRLSLDAMKPVHAAFGASGWADYHTRLRDKIPALTECINGMLS